MSQLPPPPFGLLANASLFIDFDGTLVELVGRPDEVTVSEELRGLLVRVASAMAGRVAIVSGRSIAQLDRFLGERVSTGLALAGSHGVERRTSEGASCEPDPPSGLDGAIAALADFAAAHPGTIVEPKSFGVTLHYRLAPETGGKARAAVEQAAEQFGFEVQLGKMMAELKVVGGDKGQAVASFMADVPMAGTEPWFIGDDLTDEAGFAAARRLGGGGILVGQPRGETAARYGLPDVAAVHGWLADALAALD